MAKEITNVLLVGVGGQGTILATRVLSGALMQEGFDVKMSEIHGMSQRGGSVVTFVRYGEKVYSPLVERGTADLILAFEKLEALRYLPYLKPGGTLVVNDLALLPAPVLLGKAEYPYNALHVLHDKVKECIVVDAAKLAEEKTGNVRTQNIVLLGALARRMGIVPETWEKVIGESVPPKTISANLQAFASGWEAKA